MRNMNFIPSMYKAIAFMTCMMLLMFFSRSKAANTEQAFQKSIAVKTNMIQLP